MSSPGSAKPVSAPAFLMLTNGGIALVGLIQGIFVARCLGPELLGVVGVLAALNATVLNFLDVRLSEVAAKLYFDRSHDPHSRGYQADVLQVCLLGTAAIGFLALILFVAVSAVSLHLFTDTPIAWRWLLLEATVGALTFLSNTLLALLRFSGRFYLLGSWHMANQILGNCLMVGAVLWHPGLEGYFIGHFAIGALVFGSTLTLSWWIWSAADQPHPWSWPRLNSVADYLRHRRMVFNGNLMGYAKMVHRGMDVLLVGMCCSDQVTGLYRFSRTLTDKLYLIYDAVNQVYFPRFLDMLGRGQRQAFVQQSLRLFLAAGVLTFGLLIAETLFLGELLRWVFSDRFVMGRGAIMILTVPLFLCLGVNVPLWAWLVSTGRVGHFTLATFAAAAVQVLGIMGFATGGPGLLTAAAAYLAYEVVVHLALVVLAYRRGLRDWLRPVALSQAGTERSPAHA